MPDKSGRNPRTWGLVLAGAFGGLLLGGLLGFLAFDSLIENEQDRAMSDYLLGLPAMMDGGYRLLRIGLGAIFGAGVGTIVGLALRKFRSWLSGV